MAKRILVPVDSKAGSEVVLDLVSDAARGTGATVRLLHVKPVPSSVVGENGRVVFYADQEMARVEAQWQSYLASVGVSLLGVPVERVVRFGQPAREILLEAEAWDADLIAMATTRRGSLERLFLRGVADRVVRRAEIPVLLCFSH